MRAHFPPFTTVDAHDSEEGRKLQELIDYYKNQYEYYKLKQKELENDGRSSKETK